MRFAAIGRQIPAGQCPIVLRPQLVSDLIVGAGPFGAPEVRVLDGLSLANLDSFFAYNLNMRSGVCVGSGR